MYPKTSPAFARRGSSASVFSDDGLDVKVLLPYSAGSDYSLKPKEKRSWECTRIHRHTMLLLTFVCSLVLWSWTIISLLPAAVSTHSLHMFESPILLHDPFNTMYFVPQRQKERIPSLDERVLTLFFFYEKAQQIYPKRHDNR